VATVYVPIEYWFRDKRLDGTVWGGIGERRLLFDRRATDISTTIYSGAVQRSGHRAVWIPYDGGNAIVHRWLSGYGEFVAKHRRYARASGEDRARVGGVTSYPAILRAPFVAFKECFVTKGGYRDGLRGLVLSVLWAWYSASAELALLRASRADPAR
jgi:hypothetical protein